VLRESKGAVMSKQSEAKDKQGYTKTPRTCSNCESFKSKKSENQFGWIDEKEMRCMLGGFKVNKTSVCNEHILKVL
jgi:hypothetical protein